MIQCYAVLLSFLALSYEKPVMPLLMIAKNAFAEKVLAVIDQYTPSGSDQECIDRLKSSITDIFTDTTLMTFGLYSGKGVTDLGMYKGCMNTTGFTYVGLTLIVADAFYISNVGICTPVQCGEKFYDQFKPAIAQVFNTLQNAIKVMPEMVHFTDAQKANHEVSRISIWRVLGILFIVSLFMLCLISTIVGYKYPNQETKSGKILQCFNFSKNLSTILYSENRIDKSLDVFNGIKVLSCMWVVLGHTFIYTMMGPIMNFNEFSEKMAKSYGYAIITNATLSVDVFFMMSGFFAALEFTREMMDQSKRNLKYILVSYVKRYLRLIPMYACLFLFSYNILSVVSDGPIFYQSRALIQNICDKYWWMNLLFINNFVKLKNICCFWTWYMANEYQFYLVSPWLAWLYLKSKKAGCMVSLMLISLSLGLTGFLSYKYNLSLFFTQAATSNVYTDNTYFNIIYYRPYTRISTYIMGILVAWAYLSYKDNKLSWSPWNSINNVFHSRVARYIMYILGYALLNYTLFSYSSYNIHPETVTKFINMVYIVFDKPLFLIGLLAIIYPILLGHGRPLLAFMGHQIFNALSKITYSIYMLHLLVFAYYSYNSIQLTEFSTLFLVIRAEDVFVATIFIALLAALMFESPLIQLQKILLSPHRSAAILASKIDNEAASLKNSAPLSPTSTENEGTEKLKVDQ